MGNVLDMNKLLAYINSLSVTEQMAFAASCETTVGYLRKAISKGQKLGESLCIKIERMSDGKVICEDIRDDVDWAFIRGTKKPSAHICIPPLSPP